MGNMFVKGAHTVCFSISFNNVNQMTLSPRTNFHCETTRSACSSVKFDNVFTHFVIPCYLCCKTKLRPRVSDRQRKQSFAQDYFYFQDVFSYINERKTSTSNCKHKHMLENGAPPDKFGVLYYLLHRVVHGFNSRINI